MRREERPLLNDIAAHPEDDTLCRVYADWLDDRGTPEDAARAELIRLQLQWPQEEDRYTPRERELLDEFGETWTAPLYQRGLMDHEYPLSSCHFRRGLIEALGELDHELFFVRGGEWLDAVPTVREVRFRYKVPMVSLAACPHLARLRGLSFGVWVEADEMRELLASRHLGALHSLQGALDEEGVRHIAGSAALAELRTLTLRYSHNPPVIEELARSKYVRLTRLDLGRNDPSLEAMRLLASHEAFAGLHDLDLGGGHLGPAAMQELARARQPAFRRLDLLDDPIGDAGLQALLTTPAFRSLEHLGLDETGISLAGEISLGHLAGLRHLHLARNSIQDRLSGLRPLRELRSLDLRETGMTAQGLRTLLTGDPFPQLEELNLGRNPLSNEAAAVLAEWLPPSVRWLDLTETQLTAAGIGVLMASPRVANLEVLFLSKSRVGRAGAEHLGRSPHLRRLTDLIIHQCDIGRQGLAALLGSANISRLLGLTIASEPLGDAGAQLIAGCSGFPRLRSLHLDHLGITDTGAKALAGSPHLSRLTLLNLNENQIGSAGTSALVRSPHLQRLFTVKLERNPLGPNGLRALVHARLPRLRRVEVTAEAGSLRMQLRERFPN